MLDYSHIKVWILAIRPKTLTAAVTPVIVGSSLAISENRFKWLPALAALLAALLLQIGSNVANDLFDYLHGVDEGERSGPLRVTQAGLITITELKNGLFIIFAAAIIVGIYLTIVGGWLILIIGVAAIISAIAYSAGPFPLGYHALGDLFVFLFFGLFAVCGTYFLQTGYISMQAVLLAVSVGLLIDNILIVNNYRDFDGDKKSGKKTLAVVIGKNLTKFQYLLNFLLAYVVVLVLVIKGFVPRLTLLSLLSLPMVVRLIKELFEETGERLNITLAKTGKTAFIFALLFLVGIILDGIVL